MRPSKYLSHLRRKTNDRHLKKLKILAHEVTGLPWPQSDRLVSFVTIQCRNAWENFARAYFLSCTLSPWKEKGSQITLSNSAIQTFDDAIDAAVRTCKPRTSHQRNRRRRDEPAWHVPVTLIKSCDEIGCSNHTEIRDTLLSQAIVFNHLSTFRNFYAHRNEETAMKAKQIAPDYSISLRRHPTEILLSPAYDRPQVLILDWIDDIEAVVELLCE